ncbi:MAG: hypothetical protein CM1200mP4_4550 [Rhodospirillaceae bacterium]|nr:MAG: hypothetical protein CM1200mP4_4550 [Rhodospirillaceae bacterium]
MGLPEVDKGEGVIQELVAPFEKDFRAAYEETGKQVRWRS